MTATVLQCDREWMEAFELLVPAGSTPTEAFRIAWEAAREVGKVDIEVRVWQIIDGDGMAPVPSDLFDAVERIARAARNRDMWKAQCEQQAQALATRHDSTREMVEALKAVRADLCNENRLNTQSIADVIWHTDIETTVDFIDATLQGTDR